MDFVSTPNAPLPAGHYSQAVVHGGLVYVAGQVPKDPVTGAIENGPIEAQTRQVLANLEAILVAAGSSLDRVLKCTVYVADMDLWEAVNRTYAEAFGAHRPARAIVPTKELHHGILIEIEAVAAVGIPHPHEPKALLM